jgi:hypothetical protein
VELLFKQRSIRLCILNIRTIETVRLVATFESYVNLVVQLLYSEFLNPRFSNKDYCNTKESIRNLQLKFKGVAPFLKRIFHTRFSLKNDKLKIIQTWNKLMIINHLLVFKIEETDLEFYFMLMFIQEEFVYFKEKLNQYMFKN